jgi:predicted metal-binding membrane protein
VIAHASPPALRVAAPLWGVLALLGASAWVVTTAEAHDMGAGPGTMDMTFPFFVGMWLSMMAAMMLPAIGPQAAGGSIAGAAGTVARRIPGVLSFGAGFLLPWAACGLLAFIALNGIAEHSHTAGCRCTRVGSARSTLTFARAW